ncbi:glycosyltransferase family 4 protein [Thermoleophilia bacterium SCSIO 60948]|nr:glycosyltransferase family 4 protein [Thermoleophilia bacterium SCSIO 60948]
MTMLRGMRVLLVAQHFAPEVTAGRFRVEPFARELAARGHEVTVVCPVPNHPSGVVEPGYRGRPIVRSRGDGVRIRHVWVRASAEKSLKGRLGLYASFGAAALLAGSIRRRQDVVLASSPPLSVGLAGMLLAERHRAPFVFDVRDPWPGAAVRLGELGPGRLLDTLSALERTLYARARTTVTVNDAFARHISEVDSAAHVEVIPNGTTRDWVDAGRTVSREPGQGFVLGYAGNLGLAQNIEVAIDAIAELAGTGALEARMLVVGDGPRRAEVEAYAEDRAPGLVEFHGLMSPREAAAVLARRTDALLVSERQDWTVSSKLYDYAALARPMVAAVRGEMATLVEREGIGLVTPADDPAGIREAIERLASNPELGSELGTRGLAFAERNLREAGARRMADVVERAGRGAGG